MTITWRIQHPTLTMRIAKACSDLLHRASDNAPPAGGFVDFGSGAFGGVDEHGDVFIIGYQGEWYTIAKPSLRTRIHNWFVGIYNRQLDGYSDDPRDEVPLRTVFGSLFDLLGHRQ